VSCAQAQGRRLRGTTWVTPDIDVTQNVCSERWCEVRVDAVTQAVEEALKVPRKKRKKSA
jgi:hypothetical protein